jgi:hypothetical protein
MASFNPWQARLNFYLDAYIIHLPPLFNFDGAKKCLRARSTGRSPCRFKAPPGPSASLIRAFSRVTRLAERLPVRCIPRIAARFDRDDVVGHHGDSKPSRPSTWPLRCIGHQEHFLLRTTSLTISSARAASSGFLPGSLV